MHPNNAHCLYYNILVQRHFEEVLENFVTVARKVPAPVNRTTVLA
jgi:hypothetical protein